MLDDDRRSDGWQIEHLTAKLTHHDSITEIVTAPAAILGPMSDDRVRIHHRGKVPAGIARLFTGAFAGTFPS